MSVGLLGRFQCLNLIGVPIPCMSGAAEKQIFCLMLPAVNNKKNNKIFYSDESVQYGWTYRQANMGIMPLFIFCFIISIQNLRRESMMLDTN